MYLQFEKREEKWKKITERLKNDIYKLERKIDHLNDNILKNEEDFKEQILQKNILLKKIDKENKRLHDELSVLKKVKKEKRQCNICRMCRMCRN